MGNRVIICGTRTYYEKEPMNTIIHRLPKGTTVVSGGATGADEMAKWITKPLEPYLHYEEHKAEWNEDHSNPQAGTIRNQLMLDLGADVVIAFRLPGKSTGTDDMVNRAMAVGVPVILWLHKTGTWVRY